MKKIIAALVVIGLAWFLLAPGPIDPIAWQPPVDEGFTGDFAEDTRLASQ